MTETKTIQLWPNGKSVTYRGDTDGDLEVMFRPEDKEFRPATKAEKRAINVEVLARMYEDRDIYCMDSSLVGDAIKQSFDSNSEFAQEFSMENVKNLRPNPDEWDLEQCKEWLEDKGIDLPEPNPWGMDRGKMLEVLKDAGEDYADDDDLEDEAIREIVVERIDDETVDGIEDWRDAVRDNAEDEEIFMWFRVSDWLATKLDEIGECVMDNAYGKWWGRTCCGQALIMDGTLQRIAEKFAD